MIVCNTITLALDDYDNKPSFIEVLLFLEISFTVIFTIELIIKLVVLKPTGYVKDTFNLFDGTLVILSIFDIILTSSNSLDVNLGVISVFRTLRILRVFKLTRRFKEMNILIKAIMKTL
jgi:hypothetical protein